jgi:mono/diheme cytochrome c family protein
MVGYIQTIHQKRYFMPPFAGTDAEAEALAAYLVGTLHGKEIVMPSPAEETGAPRGDLIFEESCSVCHGLEEIAPAMADWDRAKIRDALDNLSAINDMMEDYDGSPEEKEALADYLVTAVKGGDK